MKISFTKSKGKVKADKKIISKLVAAALWVVIWQLAYMVVRQDVLIASPYRTIRRLVKLLSESEFWLSAGNSLLRVMVGFLLAIAAGIIIAILTSSVPAAHEFFMPAISIIKATPVASFIILALVWLNRNMVSVFISFLMVLPVVWTNITHGIARTDKRLLEMGYVFNFSRMKMLNSIYIPSVMPYFTAAFTAGIGLSWKAGIAAEVIGIPLMSIGRHLYDAKIYLETEELFAWTLVVILLSIVVERILVSLIRKTGKKYNAAIGAEAVPNK